MSASLRILPVTWRERWREGSRPSARARSAMGPSIARPTTAWVPADDTAAPAVCRRAPK